MKTTKSLILLFVGSLIAIKSYATEIEDFMSWAQMDNGSAWIKYNSGYSDESKILESEISHSKSGGQRLYFSDYNATNINSCKYTTTIPDSTTMIFNGQAVKMSRWCQKFRDSSSYYFSLTPETERGHNYVVNLFKVATSPIEIQFNNERTYFPVIGFTKAWNSAGGNAI
ncbi:hypothetical protein [Psychrobacter vallis]|uniref:hypothetical protein n=1 Tax=Psychrobacter vallis TaxID=248451 RepID=UPI00191A24D9|nr:hypothetical protein [Psychrobacter vallis]